MKPRTKSKVAPSQKSEIEGTSRKTSNAEMETAWVAAARGGLTQGTPGNYSAFLKRAGASKSTREGVEKHHSAISAAMRADIDNPVLPGSVGHRKSTALRIAIVCQAPSPGTQAPKLPAQPSTAQPDAKSPAQKNAKSQLDPKPPSQNTWDPDDSEGRPEDVVAHMAHALSEDHRVVVFASPRTTSMWTLPLSNPWYQPINVAVDFHDKFDIVIVQGRTDFSAWRTLGKKLYFWPVGLRGVPSFSDTPDAVLFHSKHQQERYIKTHPELKNALHAVSGYGLDSAFGNPGAVPDTAGKVPTGRTTISNPHSCIYAADCGAGHEAGLKTLLEIWPGVKAAFPRATLKVYRLDDEVREAEGIKNLAQQGVEDCGKVTSDVLADALRKTSVFAYPCGDSETEFSVTVVRAQGAGAIPITTRAGPLAEIVHPDAPTVPSVETAEGRNEYFKALLGALEKAVTTDRQPYIDFGKKYTWKECANTWIAVGAERSKAL